MGAFKDFSFVCPVGIKGHHALGTVPLWAPDRMGGMKANKLNEFLNKWSENGQNSPMAKHGQKKGTKMAKRLIKHGKKKRPKFGRKGNSGQMVKIVQKIARNSQKSNSSGQKKKHTRGKTWQKGQTLLAENGKKKHSPERPKCPKNVMSAKGEKNLAFICITVCAQCSNKKNRK